MVRTTAAVKHRTGAAAGAFSEIPIETLVPGDIVRLSAGDMIPEMLPMIVTVNLAKGVIAMAREKAIVKRLNAIQNFGAIDILCADTRPPSDCR